MTPNTNQEREAFEAQAAWRIEYENDTGPNDGGFWEWWDVTNGEQTFRADTETSANFLLSLLARALPMGAEPAATVTISKFRGYLENTGFELLAELPDGTHKLYIAPLPAMSTVDARDAARYRWLRQQENEDFEFAVVKNPHFDIYGADELDAAIDAALAASPKEPTP